MKVVYNKFLPVKGFCAINLFGIIFIRDEYRKYDGKPEMQQTINHESIHTKQMRELLYVFFYILYLLEWIYRLLTPPMKTAYRDISFEREAFAHENDFEYTKTRKPYSFIKYWRNENR